MIVKIEKTRERPEGGNPLVIDLEISGKIIQIEITCPTCGYKLYWLAEDHSILYCGKCRSIMGTRHGDFADTNEIKWKIT